MFTPTYPNFQDGVFWVVMPCSAVVKHYTASQSRRHRLETSPPVKTSKLTQTCLFVCLFVF